MIRYNNSTSFPGITITDCLAYVDNCNVLNTRNQMEGVVRRSALANVDNWQDLYTNSYYNVPFDSTSSDSPAKQFYTYLMTQPEFEGGAQYP